MLVPLSWLKEYVDISGVSVNDLQKKMSAAGLSVERKHTVGEGIEHIVVGEIVSKEKHKDSDHLWVCKVDLGAFLSSETDSSFTALRNTADTSVQIVTGAQNIFVHAKVPVVLAGSQLPGGVQIEATVLRGETSQGMMCSERELGLGDAHEGIMILGADAFVGTRLVDYLGLPDVVFDTEITANRGDCLSIIGIAREVATILGKELKLPKREKMASLPASQYSLSVSIQNPDKCNRFAAVAYDNFQLDSSPVWMQQRLLRAGMRPINNLVDISNYVMLEFGQPTHAYDAAQIAQHGFIVRDARPNEKLQTLDKKVYDLTVGTLLIADPEKNLGIAGIMGGESSKITDETHSIILEIANFEPVQIRKAGMKLGIRTDAIVRYERGVDPDLVGIALERINYLLESITGAQQASSVVDEYPRQNEERSVSLRSESLSRYLGIDMAESRVEKILESLGFSVVSREGDESDWLLTVTIPSWRSRDISIEEDLIEEVARIYGYDNIPSALPSGVIPHVTDNKRLKVKRKTLTVMRGLGFQEVLTYSFNSKEQIVQSGYSIDKALEMVSPLSEEHRYMRLSLLPNLLDITHKNEVLGRDLFLFELSSVYIRKLYDLIPDEAVSLALEPLHFAGVVSLQKYSFDSAYRAMRSRLEALFADLKVSGISFSQDQQSISKLHATSMYHPGRVGAILLFGAPIGLYGEIHPAYAEALHLHESACMFELNYDVLVDQISLVTQYKQYSVFPASTESLSFILDDSLAVGPIVTALRSVDERIVHISVSAPYRGDQIASGKKALTLTFVYQSITGPIRDTDAQQLRESIISTMITRYSAQLRH